MPVLNLSTGGASASPPPWTKIAAIDGANTATQNANALQAWATAMKAHADYYGSGALGMIPPISADINGPTVLEEIDDGEMAVTAFGANLHYTGAGAMFSTALPATNTAAEAANDVQEMWSWYGGRYRGASTAGTRAFEWNCASRIDQARVRIENFDENILVRFGLHYHLHDFLILTAVSYNLRIEENGDWTGGTASNAAGNGALVNHGKFSARDGMDAQVRIAHCGHLVHDVTMEGGDPQIQFDFFSDNNSVMSSTLSHIWIESDPTVAVVRIDTNHDYEVDFLHCTTSAVPKIQVVTAKMIHVGRFGSAKPNDLYAGLPMFETTAFTKWFFHKGGYEGEFDPTNAALWVGGVKPTGLYADGAFLDGSGSASVFMSNYQNRIDRFNLNSGVARIGTTVVGTQT